MEKLYTSKTVFEKGWWEDQGRRQGGGQGGLAPPIDTLGPPNQQAYSFQDNALYSYFKHWLPPDKRLAPLSRLFCRRLWGGCISLILPPWP